MEPQKIKILVVEDDADVREYYMTILEDEAFLGIQPNFEITQARDGLEGLQICHEHKYDLILLDIQMPKLDGVNFMSALRRNDGPNQKTPVIIISGFPEHYKERLTMEQWPQVFWIDKPIDVEKFSRNVVFAIHKLIFKSKNSIAS